MKTQLLSPLVVFLLMIALSCGKKEDDPNLTNTQKLTQKTWKLTKVGFQGLSSPPDACNADDVYTFSTAGVYTQDEGGSKCDVSDPQTTTGTWEFTTNETRIKVVIGSVFTLDKEIVELTSSKLRLKYNVIFDIEETYEH